MSKEEVVESSGNIFEDLGYANAQEALAKAKLAHQIHKIIKCRKLTQEEAAEIIGIDQPKVSAIVRGKLSGFTIDRLFRFLMALGQDIEIKVKPHVAKRKPPSIIVKEGECRAIA